ncbi:MAG: hypothetical protein EOM06_15500, partial [Sphingobacteriia bacterium]|nr:hypothetical protein [Sphingobacteriia bacterium]
MTDIRRMLAFTILETKEDDYPTLNKHDILKYGKSDLLLRMDFNIPLKSGYRINDNSSVNSKAYEGTPFYN